MNVLVLGGTRGLGRAVVAAAHAAGHTLTVLARHPGELDAAVSGVRMVVGDVADALDVERAMIGQEAVVWSVRARGKRELAVTYSRGMHGVLAAMAALQVRRLLCVTGAAPARRLPLVSASLVRAWTEETERLEGQVRASAVDWTIVRAAPLTDRDATGLYQALPQAPIGRPRAIARGDVAAFVVDNLASPDHLRATVYLSG